MIRWLPEIKGNPRTLLHIQEGLKSVSLFIGDQEKRLCTSIAECGSDPLFHVELEADDLPSLADCTTVPIRAVAIKAGANGLACAEASSTQGFVLYSPNGRACGPDANNNGVSDICDANPAPLGLEPMMLLGALLLTLSIGVDTIRQ